MCDQIYFTSAILTCMHGDVPRAPSVHLAAAHNSYWHEYLDLVLSYKAINELIDISPGILPRPVAPNRFTRSTSDTNALLLLPSNILL